MDQSEDLGATSTRVYRTGNLVGSYPPSDGVATLKQAVLILLIQRKLPILSDNWILCPRHPPSVVRTDAMWRVGVAMRRMLGQELDSCRYQESRVAGRLSLP